MWESHDIKEPENYCSCFFWTIVWIGYAHTIKRKSLSIFLSREIFHSLLNLCKKILCKKFPQTLIKFFVLFKLSWSWLIEPLHSTKWLKLLHDSYILSFFFLSSRMNIWATIFTILRYYFFIHTQLQTCNIMVQNWENEKSTCVTRERVMWIKKIVACICVDYGTMTVFVCHAF